MILLYQKIIHFINNNKKNKINEKLFDHFFLSLIIHKNIINVFEKAYKLVKS